MAFSRRADLGESRDVRAELQELRAHSLRWVVVCVVPILWMLIVFLRDERPETALWPIAVVLVCVEAVRLLRTSVSLASSLLVVALLGGVSLAIRLYPGGAAACSLSLVVLIAVMLLGPRPSVAVAVVATAVVAAGMTGPDPVISSLIGTTALALIWGALVISWLTTQPIYTALDWSWSSYEQAVRRTHELRERQIELGRVNKSLNEAYEHLEHLNAELTRARQAAEEARQLKAEFVSNISHELRTPLNLIIGFSEVMVMAPQVYGAEALPSTYRADVHAIYHNALHLSKLIDDVLDLSRIEAGRLGLVKERLSLAGVVEEAVAVVGPMLATKGLSLTVNVPSDLPEVFADRTRIRQVLINLLSNAARFTEEGGVAVSVTTDGREVVTAVADTGPGMAPEDIPRAFEEFRQLDGSSRRKQGGSGLGLAISRDFVELHGGAMWAESEPGRGSTFYFSLPLAEQVAAVSLPGDWRLLRRVAAAPAPSAPLVRVSAHDETLARLFQRHLDGYRVATDDAEASAPADGPARAVVISTRTVAEGWRRLQAARESEGDVPVVVCALSSQQDIARELKVADYLVKPVAREQLLAALERLGSRIRQVLVVDDDPEMVRLLARMVRSSDRGYRVSRATSGPEALVVLHRKRPDVVLLDLLMPETDGYEILKVMRSDRRLRSIPVIVITARGAREETVAASLIGITRGGGFSAAELMRCLRASLDALVVTPTPDLPEPPSAPAAAPPG